MQNYFRFGRCPGGLAAVAAVVVLACGWGRSARAATFTPQAGINISNVTDDPEGGQVSSKMGYQFGATLRFGTVLFIQPGVFWQQQSAELNWNGVAGDVRVDGISIPVMFGIGLVFSDSFMLRIQTGPVWTVVNSVGDNPFELTSEDFADRSFGMAIGFAMDISFVMIDLGYEFGIEDIFDTQAGSETYKSQTDTFRANVGISF